MNEIIEVKSDPSLISLRNNIRTAISESKTIIVFNEKDIERAGFYIKKFGELDKKLESLRKEVVKPLNDEVKSINEFFKEIQSEFQPEQNRLKKESNEVLLEIRRRQEEEKKREQKELEDSILKEAETFEDETILDNIPQIEYKRAKIAEDNLTTVRTKKWKVTDLKKVSSEFLMIDEKKLNNVRKEYDFDAKSPFEGIEFYCEETVRVK